MTSLIVIAGCFWCIAGHPVQQTPAPTETHQFDFWLGSWKCSGESFDQQGKKTATEAENLVTSELNGHVLHEHFRMDGLTGFSFSVYDPTGKKWRQTWVDDQGSFISLTGAFQDGKMTLTTGPNPTNPKRKKRMVFENITPDSFDWNWEGTVDGGQKWDIQWHLHYVRAKA